MLMLVLVLVLVLALVLVLLLLLLLLLLLVVLVLLRHGPHVVRRSRGAADAWRCDFTTAVYVEWNNAIFLLAFWSERKAVPWRKSRQGVSLTHKEYKRKSMKRVYAPCRDLSSFFFLFG